MLRTVPLAALLLALARVAPAADDPEIEKHLKNLNVTGEKPRVAALNELAKMGAKAGPALRPVCDRVTDKSQAVREAAFAAVEAIDPMLYKPLREVVLAKEGEDRIKQLEALGALKEKAKPTAGVLTQMLTAVLAKAGSAPAETYEEEAAATIGCLRDVGADDKATLTALKGAAGAKVPSALVRWRAVAALSAWAGDDKGRRKEVVAVLAPMLADRDLRLAFLAAEKAGNYGADAATLLPAVKKLKTSSDAELRKAADEAAAKIEKAVEKK